MRDYEIRKVLRETTLKKFIKDSDSKIVDELDLPITKSRVDIAVVNGHLHGYEIKSARDTLHRLPHQIEGYTKIFDYITVVTEGKHHERILKLLPEWVGVQLCNQTSNGVKIKTIRKPYYNKNKKGFFIAKLLRRDEVINILKRYDISYSNKDTLWRLCENLEENLALNKLSKVVRETLKMRQDWKIKEYYSSTLYDGFD